MTVNLYLHLNHCFIGQLAGTANVACHLPKPVCSNNQHVNLPDEAWPFRYLAELTAIAVTKELGQGTIDRMTGCYSLGWPALPFNEIFHSTLCVPLDTKKKEFVSASRRHEHIYAEKCRDHAHTTHTRRIRLFMIDSAANTLSPTADSSMFTFVYTVSLQQS